MPKSHTHSHKKIPGHKIILTKNSWTQKNSQKIVTKKIPDAENYCEKISRAVEFLQKIFPRQKVTLTLTKKFLSQKILTKKFLMPKIPSKKFPLPRKSHSLLRKNS